ncbi:MFS transporter [Actinoplanes sp. CA-054009]
MTTVSVSLPAIQRGLGASTSDLSWVSDAFVLPMAALILTAGVFGDVHGRKKVFQAGLLLCALGAAVALCAQSTAVVWAGQVLAGMGAAALLPATLALISHAVPDPRARGKPIGWRLALFGLGLGFVLTPMTATAVGSVPHHLAGMAAAGNNAFRQFGGALGPAVLGAILTSRAAATCPPTWPPPAWTAPPGSPRPRRCGATASRRSRPATTEAGRVRCWARSARRSSTASTRRSPCRPR